MAKPSWITIVNGSTGSGSVTKMLKAAVHTGSYYRTGSITGTTSSGSQDTVTITQSAADLYIAVDTVKYSVAALGGSITIKGTSNSNSLKISSLSDSSVLSGWTLKIDGDSKSTWNGSDKHYISGNPGSSAAFSFEITATVAENRTESARDITFEINDAGYKPTSGTITISQAAGVKTYAAPVASISYSPWSIPASGGTCNCVYSFYVKWGWNGKTDSGTLNESSLDHTASFAYYSKLPSQYNWTLDKSTGTVIMPSLGKTVTSSDSGNISIEVTINIPSLGKKCTARDYVKQAKNSVSYTISSVNVTHADIPASGGSANSPVLSSFSGKKAYSSGDSEPITSTSGTTITLSKTVNASNLGTTIKARTKLNTVTATVTWNGVSKTQSLDIYQQANAVIDYSAVTATSQSFTVAKTGGSFSLKDSPAQKKTFTSGSSLDITDFTYSFSDISSSIAVNELTLTATVAKNATGSRRSGSVTVTITGENNKSKTIAMSFSQASCAMPYWNAPSNYEFDSIGQGQSPAGIEITVTDTDNVGWSVQGPSFVAWSDASGNKFPYYGIGTTSLYLSPGQNTGTTQREFSLYLVNHDGTTRISICRCVQSAATVVEDTVQFGLGINGSDGLFDYTEGYPNVIISPFGDYANALADGINLGKMSEPDSEYVYIDAVKSKLSDLKSKLSGDWKKYSYFYIIVLGGTTTADTVYNNEYSEWEFYDKENFCLCEINRERADFDTVVDNMVNDTMCDITSDCITEEYGSRKHMIFKANKAGKSILTITSNSDFSDNDKVALYLTLSIDGGTMDNAIYPLRKAIPSTALSYVCEMYIYRMLPLPQTELSITGGVFETTQSDPSEFVLAGTGTVGYTIGNLVSVNNPTIGQSDSLLMDDPIDSGTRGHDFELSTAIDLSRSLSTDDITVTINCNNDDFAELV